ncbi:MAG: metallophosphoesterase [Desulfobacteraceae bacterium]|nr:metallophosphoesterase [Desulfobacteraceae bacterium]
MRLLVFLSVFLTLYGLLHFYAFLKVTRAFALSRGVSVFLVCVMLFMVFCPVIVRVLERVGMETLPRFLAYTGYTWMGFLLVFVCCYFLIDFFRLLGFVGTHFLKMNLENWILSQRTVFFIALTVSSLVTMYGHLEALTIRTERITIRTPKIPKELGRLRIVQISDVHLGLIVRGCRLEKILREVRAARPDILVSTGDLLDGQINDVSNTINSFRLINAPYGKFAVTGNHEFYAGLERSLNFMKEVGFTVLRGETRDVRGVVLVAGVDDQTANRFGLSKGVTEAELLSNLPGDRFVLLLKHRPLVDQGSDGLFDLQLSGHTHGGQIFPFSLIIKMLYPVDAGLLALNNGALLYVSPGSGTWGPPMRFLAPPEVTVIDLIHGEKPE